MENAYQEEACEVWFELQNIWQKSSKDYFEYYYIEILWVNFIKLFNNLKAFTSLHRTYCSHCYLTKCQWVCGQNYPKTSSFFWIFSCRNFFLTKATDSCFLLLKKYLIVVDLSRITLSLNHSIMACMSDVGEETNKRETEYSISNTSSAREAVTLILQT